DAVKMDLTAFPEYNGSCHPEDWLRKFKFIATVQEKISSEFELISLALLKITDTSFHIFKIEAGQKLLVLRLTHLTDSILKILPTKFSGTFSLKFSNSQNVFMNLRDFLSKYTRVIKYGSVITLRHINTEKLLSSSLHRYTGGTNQYWAYAVDSHVTGPTDNELWTIMPVNNGNKQRGSVVCYGDETTLLNNGTGQKLHSHELNQNHKNLTCQTFKNSDDNWAVQHGFYNISSEDKEPWYMLNNEYQEVTCFGDKANTSK
ncbi:16928_t:CDS:2, partial [Cetraspora pellucida]